MDNKEIIKLLCKVELARRNFYYYCKLMYPDFYKDDRDYLKLICDTLQEFYESDKDDVLIINCPPRFGKSLTLMNFCEWVLGKNKNNKIMTSSYNETLSSNFSKGVRNKIMEQKVDKEKIVYSDLFDSKIKKGDGAIKLWSLDGAYSNYLATSPSGTATGFGATIEIIDDLIKNAEEAFNTDLLEKHYDWFVNTMLSRLEAGGKLIVVFTRWSKKDLVGRLIENYERRGRKFIHINLRAEKEDGSLLCEEILNKEKIEELKELMSKEIYNANYNQEPLDLKGCLYTKMNTYKYSDLYEIEKEEFDEKTRHNKYIFKTDKRGNKIYKIPFEKIINYTDTADEGADYLASITAGIYKRKIYILDIIYTQVHMEDTEIMVEKALRDFEVNLCRIESNNGGEGFARNVDRLRKENGNKITTIKTFTQNKNKNSRILSNKDNIMNNVFFMEDFSLKNREAFKNYIEYQAVGKNAHDDFEDALTGIYETFEKLGYYNY